MSCRVGGKISLALAFDIVLESAVRTIKTAENLAQDAERKFIGKDGGLVSLPGRRMTRISAEILTRQ